VLNNLQTRTMMNFFQRNARLIVPVPWFVVSGLKLWQAVHGGDHFHYFGAFAFGTIALLFYLGQTQIYRKRQKEKG
jgi:hypothetical protein